VARLQGLGFIRSDCEFKFLVDKSVAALCLAPNGALPLFLLLKIVYTGCWRCAKIVREASKLQVHYHKNGKCC